jgi:hypothetical protein
MLKKLLIALIVLAGIILVPMSSDVYVLRGSAGGVMYWNPTEALLFFSEGSDGARMNSLRYVLEPFLLAVGIVRHPNDERCTRVLVIRVTDKEIQPFNSDLYRYTGEPGCGFHIELFNGRFYAADWPKL